MLEEKDIQAIAQLILASEERLRGEIGQVEERLRVEFHSKLETEIHASEERTRTGIQEEIRASEDRLRGEMGQVEDRLRTEFQSKLETEIRASEERLRTEFHSQMKEEIHASETRTHAYIESGVMKPIRLLAEGHAQTFGTSAGGGRIGFPARTCAQFGANRHRAGPRDRRPEARISPS